MRQNAISGMLLIPYEAKTGLSAGAIFSNAFIVFY